MNDNLLQLPYTRKVIYHFQFIAVLSSHSTWTALQLNHRSLYFSFKTDSRILYRRSSSWDVELVVKHITFQVMKVEISLLPSLHMLLVVRKANWGVVWRLFIELETRFSLIFIAVVYTKFNSTKRFQTSICEKILVFKLLNLRIEP